jgi:hypothetical protein
MLNLENGGKNLKGIGMRWEWRASQLVGKETETKARK